MWFAFILLSLSYWKQHGNGLMPYLSGCDLLSFYYLCRTGNNFWKIGCIPIWVVICFHFTIFVVLETTQNADKDVQHMLWFAFILLSLSYWKQPPPPASTTDFGCDLLSFYYLCRTGNNYLDNQFQDNKLWFAFILLSLSYWKQQFECRQIEWQVVICFHFTIFVVLETTTRLSFRYDSCCDLLSFYYLCRTGNNWKILRRTSPIVVICFHFTIFVVLETTYRQLRRSRTRLWFAFILLSLSYWKQHLFFLVVK